MKKWTVLLTSLLFILTACCQRGDRNTSTGTAAVAAANTINTNCLNTGSFNNNLYTNGNCGQNTNTNNNQAFQQYPVNQQHGFYQGYSSGYQSGFTACPYGTIPTYSAGYGLNCVSTAHLGNMQKLAYWSWNASSFDFSFGGYQQYDNYDYYDYGHVAQSCGAGNSCGLGACVGLDGGGFSLDISIGLCDYGGYDDYDYDNHGYDDVYYKTGATAASSRGGGCGL